MKKLKIVFLIIIVLFTGIWVIRLHNGRRFHLEKETRFMMDTYVTVYALGPKKVTAKAVSLALDRMQEIDVKFNALNPRSPVYAFNHHNIPISDTEITGLVGIALKASKETKGAFDITVAPLLELWGFYSKAYRVPDEQEIKNCLEKVGYQHLLINNGKLTKDSPETQIDLGGVAKGYALVEAVKVLKAKGVHSALIDAGGDVFALGKKGRRLWKVGIKSPREDDLLGYLEIQDLAVMGSGDYERFFIKDGKRYHHIFNPKTGYPTEGVAAVTLIYSDPVLGQIWGKIPFLMGTKKGLQELDKIPGVEAVVVTGSGEILYTSGFKHLLKVIPKEK